MQVKNVGESLSNGIGQALLSTVIHSAMSKEGEAILALILHPKGVRIIYSVIPDMLGGGKRKYIIIMVNTMVVSCPDPPISAALRYIW